MSSKETFQKKKDEFRKRELEILEVVRDNPNITCEKLLSLMDTEDHNKIAPRLSELKSKGLVIVSQRVKNAKNITVNAYSVNPNPPREEYKQIKRYSNLFLQEEFKDVIDYMDKAIKIGCSDTAMVQAIIMKNKLEKLLR